MYRIIGQPQIFLDEPLGAGGYGSVFKGKMTAERNGIVQDIDIAIKRIEFIDKNLQFLLLIFFNRRPMGQSLKELIKKLTMKEIRIYEQSIHKNIVRYYGHTVTENYIDIYLELCEGSLKTIFDKLPLEEYYAFEVFCQILEATLYLKTLTINNKKGEIFVGFYHRDLNLKNVLMLKGQVKLTDFGLSRQTLEEGEKLTKQQGTAIYMSPQNYHNKKYDLEKNDVWSMGIMLYQLLHGYQFSQIDCYNQTLRINPNLSPECIHLIRSMIEPDEKRRFSFDQIAHHSLVSKYIKNRSLNTIAFIQQKLEAKCQNFKQIQLAIDQADIDQDFKKFFLDYVYLNQVLWLLKKQQNYSHKLGLLGNNQINDQICEQLSKLRFDRPLNLQIRKENIHQILYYLKILSREKEQLAENLKQQLQRFIYYKYQTQSEKCLSTIKKAYVESSAVVIN